MADRVFPAKERQRSDEEIAFARRHEIRPDPVPNQERGIPAWIRMMVRRLDDINANPEAREFWDALEAWQEDWAQWPEKHPKHFAKQYAKEMRLLREAGEARKQAQDRPGAHRRRK